jgi:single-strand DNA-binding protein|tara:strand:+ start:245 stop:655 length:411 start_codon:yes stop_codon:yes gene_type:complete
MNSCHFIGRLVADPELNDVNETSVVRFTLAINEYRKSRDGEKSKKVDYLDFEAWDTGATTIDRYCQKGDELAVLATARQDKWTDKEGNKRSKIKFRVNRFKLFNNGNNSHREESREESQDSTDPVVAAAASSEAPF